MLKGRAIPRALGAKPKDGGLEAVHPAAPSSVAGNVDELGVHDQLQDHCQQLKPGSRPSCKARLLKDQMQGLDFTTLLTHCTHETPDW